MSSGSQWLYNTTMKLRPFFVYLHTIPEAESSRPRFLGNPLYHIHFRLINLCRNHHQGQAYKCQSRRVGTAHRKGLDIKDHSKERSSPILMSSLRTPRAIAPNPQPGRRPTHPPSPPREPRAPREKKPFPNKVPSYPVFTGYLGSISNYLPVAVKPQDHHQYFYGRMNCLMLFSSKISQLCAHASKPLPSPNSYVRHNQCTPEKIK